MPKNSISPKIVGMMHRRMKKALMELEGNKGLLMLQKMASLFPSIHTFVSLIDNITPDRHLIVIDKGIQLFVDELNVISRRLSRYVDVLEQFSLVVHLLLNNGRIIRSITFVVINRKLEIYILQSSHHQCLAIIILLSAVMIGTTLPPNKLLQTEQALIPQVVKKSLESKALLQYYQESQSRKQHSNRQQIDQRLREIQNRERSYEYQQLQMQKMKMAKQNIKNQYSRQYDQMMQMQKQKELDLKNRVINFEQNMLNHSSWLRDPSQERQMEKMKRLEYGKQLEQHLKMQEDKRAKEALKILELRERLKKQSEDSQKKLLSETEAKYRKKSDVEQRINGRPGAKDAMNWSVDGNDMSLQRNRRREVLTPRMDRLLKVQEQQYYGKGLQVDYKSQRQKRYFESQNPQQQVAYNLSQNYNPITNPIQYKYKNPYILKLLSKYG